jgi:hypothetical protein
MEILLLLLAVVAIVVLCRRKKTVWAIVLGVCVLGVSAYIFEAGSAQRSLREAASRTTKVVIEIRVVIDTVGAVETIEVSSKEDVAAFFDVLRLERSSVLFRRVCECSGNPHIQLHDANGPFAKISIHHHGEFIRCSWCSGNINIREDMIPKVKQYFESLGVELEKLDI